MEAEGRGQRAEGRRWRAICKDGFEGSGSASLDEETGTRSIGNLGDCLKFSLLLISGWDHPKLLSVLLVLLFDLHWELMIALQMDY